MAGYVLIYFRVVYVNMYYIAVSNVNVLVSRRSVAESGARGNNQILLGLSHI